MARESAINAQPRDVVHRWAEQSEWSISNLGLGYVKRLGEVKDGKSVRQVEVGAIVDFNADGQLIGIEVIGGVDDHVR